MMIAADTLKIQYERHRGVFCRCLRVEIGSRFFVSLHAATVTTSAFRRMFKL
jgi:hypothetical protein